MKKSMLLLTLLALVLCTLGQVPQKFSYQASIRNSDGTSITNSVIDVNIYLRKSTFEGDVVYTESHSTTTSNLGIISLIVGEGTNQIGSLLQVPWSDNIFLQIDVKLPGAQDYSTIGVSQILSVPYAFKAGNAIQGEGNLGATVAHDGTNWVPNNQIEISNNTVGVSTQDGRDVEEPIFSVKNSNNEVVFAVYESGVRFYIKDPSETKGSKGGFAIGGLTPSKSEEEETLFVSILPQSMEFNIVETESSKPGKGGFAIGGLSPSKNIPTNEYLLVQPNEIRFTVRDDEKSGTKGGFAIGGLTPSKETIDYVTVAKDSTFIYTNLTTTGDLNVAGNLYTGGDITSPPVSYNGYTYQTVQIGDQLWMKENLRTILYQDGSAINTFNDVFDYQTNPLYRDSVGLLYSSTAVRSANGLCPEGWHIPNQGDWEQMFNWLGGDYWYEKLDLIAVRLLEVGFWDEAMGDLTPNNLSGFSIRPGGWGLQPTVTDPEFFEYGLKAYFWTSGDGWGDPLAGAFVFSPVSGESITPIFEMDLQYNELYYVRCLKWDFKDE